MRRGIQLHILCLMLAAGVLLGACAAKPDQGVYGELCDAYNAFAQTGREHLGFMLEATFRDEDSGETGTLYYMQGDAKYDKDADLAWQKFTATLLAATYNAEEYYQNGKKMHIESGETYELDAPNQTFFGAFPYCKATLPAFADLQTLTVESNGDAALYTLTASVGQKELLELWQLDLYTLAGVVVPNREKETFGDVTYTFSVKDGKVSSLTVKLTASIYETPAYTPGFTPDDENYRLDLHLTAQISVKASGDAVEIPTYSEANE